MLGDSVPVGFAGSCRVVKGVFTDEECEQLKAKIVNPTHINTTGNDEQVVRIVQKMTIQDSDVASYLYDKVVKHGVVPSTFQISQEDPHLGPFVVGSWAISSVSPNIQIYKYEPGGVFQQHRDGPTLLSPDERSLFTVLAYLNTGYSGGRTTLFSESGASWSVPVHQGACFSMLQSVLHEGGRVESGQKYALRCDVMYRRAGGTLEESLKGLSTKEQAQKWYQLASSMELSGAVGQSLIYYKKAYKLDPELEG
eukprot:TRINITY_DN7014_c0_g1_i1.p1 TRINITY_DN7014_c0_g1~~TRINITY_DN7014_c0_g1_i1.p1  ORF type:complete len:253 (-),score=38.58 TRINITY_DN7014_c0_g1_i1:31-789(-)